MSLKIFYLYCFVLYCFCCFLSVVSITSFGWFRFVFRVLLVHTINGLFTYKMKSTYIRDFIHDVLTGVFPSVLSLGSSFTASKTER